MSTLVESTRVISTKKLEIENFEIPTSDIDGVIVAIHKDGYWIIWKVHLHNSYWPLVLEAYVANHDVRKLTHRSMHKRYIGLANGKRRRTKRNQIQFNLQNLWYGKYFGSICDFLYLSLPYSLGLVHFK